MTIPYGRQTVDEDDIQAVVDVLKSDYLTTGPKIAEFEGDFSDHVNAWRAVAFSSGTAALHGAMYALGIKPGDEVIVPAITFVATANCVVYMGGTPVFCDVEADTLCMDPDKLAPLINKRTKAIIAMDYAGQVCDYNKISDIAAAHNLRLVADACHSLGAQEHSADISVYSFHPVKHITTGEGGMAVTDSRELADKMRSFRNHGMVESAMVDLGYNYRITDIQCALGISQLKKLYGWIEQRREIAQRYDELLPDKFEKLAKVRSHVYHLYVVKVPRRVHLMSLLLQAGIRTQIHYRPVFYHPYYWTRKAGCPVAEDVYRQILSLPIYPGLTRDQQDYVIQTLEGLAWPK